MVQLYRSVCIGAFTWRLGSGRVGVLALTAGANPGQITALCLSTNNREVKLPLHHPDRSDGRRLRRLICDFLSSQRKTFATV